ncbi:MAG: hypothetical protein ABJB11_04390 [Ferruginibacter sp.]
MIFVAASAFSQKLPAKSTQMLLLQNLPKAAPTSLIPISKAPVTNTPKQIISPGLYVSRLGFFCKQEIKLEKITKIPFRFRLGSIEDCDRMEGKFKRSN